MSHGDRSALRLDLLTESDPLLTIDSQASLGQMKGHLVISIKKSLWLILPLLVSCGPASSIACNTAALPYQYEVATDGDRYFVTLIPLESVAGRQTFFMSETSSPLTTPNAIRNGDPAGRIVAFERRGEDLVATELGLSFDDVEVQSMTSRSATGVTHFDHKGASYSLRSCDGILSGRFRRDFPALFH